MTIRRPRGGRLAKRPGLRRIPAWSPFGLGRMQMAVPMGWPIFLRSARTGVRGYGRRGGRLEPERGEGQYERLRRHRHDDHGEIWPTPAPAPAGPGCRPARSAMPAPNRWQRHGGRGKRRYRRWRQVRRHARQAAGVSHRKQGRGVRPVSLTAIPGGIVPELRSTPWPRSAVIRSPSAVPTATRRSGARGRAARRGRWSPRCRSRPVTRACPR